MCTQLCEPTCLSYCDAKKGGTGLTVKVYTNTKARNTLKATDLVVPLGRAQEVILKLMQEE
jgi:hypothetical protein